jgi:hypothetical protein
MRLATKVLERDVLRHDAANVTSTWDRKDDPKGYPVYTLQLSESTNRATKEFTPTDLRSESRVKRRLRFLWDDLLRLDLHQRLARLREGK